MYNTDSIRPLWIEGILLGQQHFQAWDDNIRYRDNLLRSISMPDHWGIVDININEISLLEGIFSVKYLLAILPSGYLIEVTEEENLKINLGSINKEYVDIYLTWSGNSFAAGAAGYPGKKEESKWFVKYKSVDDKFDISRKQEIAYLCMNFKLQKDAGFNKNSLHIARIKCNSLVNYTLDDDLIFPVLHINTNSKVINIIKFIKNILKNKYNELDKIKNSAKDNSNNLKNELLIIQIQSLLNSCYVRLKFFLHNGLTHPVEVFKSLMGFVASLMPYIENNVKENIENILCFSQEKINSCFDELKELLIDIVNTINFQNENFLKSNRIDKNKYEIDLSFGKIKNKLILLKLKDETDKIDFNKLPAICKISSPGILNKLIISSMPGISIEKISSLPKGIISIYGCNYFIVKQSGELWDMAIKEEKLIFYFPNLPDNFTLEAILAEK